MPKTAQSISVRASAGTRGPAAAVFKCFTLSSTIRIIRFASSCDAAVTSASNMDFAISLTDELTHALTHSRTHRALLLSCAISRVVAHSYTASVILKFLLGPFQLKYLSRTRTMKTAAAYLLAKLGGVAEPSAADIARILGSGTFLCHACDRYHTGRLYVGHGRRAHPFGRRNSRSRPCELRAARRPFPARPWLPDHTVGAASFFFY